MTLACGGTTLAIFFVSPAQAGAQFPGIGRAATPAEVAAWDIDVRPDFKGLPPGSGSVAKGRSVWDAKCASCHGSFGESNEVFTPLVGGTTAEDIKAGRVKSLAAPEQRTTLMKLATISTLWDYVNRAMPWNAPKTLTTEEVYAVVAYLLNLGDIVPADYVLSNANIADVQARLPNRNGMSRVHGLWDIKAKGDVANVACMRACPVGDRIASSLPENADTHGNLAEQQRLVGGMRGTPSPSDGKPAAAAPMPIADLARGKGCLSCHGLDQRIVGPSFKEVAARYKGQAGVEAKLLGKVRRGGSGGWGSIPMPPMPDLSETDAAALVRWILGGAG
ncbi:MAG: c-type cytochrome [Usitatibacter sp.]